MGAGGKMIYDSLKAGVCGQVKEIPGEYDRGAQLTCSILLVSSLTGVRKDQTGRCVSLCISFHPSDTGSSVTIRMKYYWKPINVEIIWYEKKNPIMAIKSAL